MSDITTVILAAGNSTRFKASKSKLVYPLCGLPIVSHIFNIAKKISGKNILVVSNEKNKEELKLILNTSKLVVQKKQKGTADAIEQVKKFVKSKNILILFGDTPLVEVKDIRKLVSKFKKSKAKASLIAFNNSSNSFKISSLSSARELRKFDIWLFCDVISVSDTIIE